MSLGALFICVRWDLIEPGSLSTRKEGGNRIWALIREHEKWIERLVFLR